MATLALLLLTAAWARPGKQPLHGEMAILHAFSSSSATNPQGFAPGSGRVLLNGSGALFGATGSGGQYGDGVVFELTAPPKSGKRWPEKVLLALSGGALDGSRPVSLAQHGGSLYGLTSCCGPNNDGVLFQLSPPTTGSQWKETVLYAFSYSPPNNVRGSQPTGDLAFDKAGDIFGTTSSGGSGNGVVFEAMPPTQPGKHWKEVAISTFKGKPDGSDPAAGVYLASDGSLLGTTDRGGTYDDGTVFRLTKPSTGTTWKEQVLYNFKGGKDGRYPGANGVIMPVSGHIFGLTTEGGIKDNGVAFELVKIGSARWKEQIIFRFPAFCSYCSDYTTPTGGLTAGKDGLLYGTTEGGSPRQWGQIFKLTPPARAGSAWTEEDLFRFDGDIGWGGDPQTGVTLDKKGVMYGAVSRLGPGGCPSACTSYGAGEVWRFVPNGT